MHVFHSHVHVDTPPLDVRNALKKFIGPQMAIFQFSTVTSSLDENEWTQFWPGNRLE
jgi:hypothetical protein